MGKNNKPHPSGIDTWVNRLIKKGFIDADGFCIRGCRYTGQGNPKIGIFKVNNNGTDLGRQVGVDGHFGASGCYKIYLTPKPGYYKSLKRYISKNPS